ncbi:MAG: NADH-quinone oxidoreductase subunit NuoF [Planctomycetaceae bacterium]
MKLLQELTRRQHQQGWLSDETLQSISAEWNVPLFRLEELVSFYTHFRREPPKPTTVNFCRDVCCQLIDGPSLREEFLELIAGRDDIEVQEVSCLGRCDHVPAVAVNGQVVSLPKPATPEHLLYLIDQPEKISEDQRTSATHSWESDPYSTKEEQYSTVRSLVEKQADLAATCISELNSAGLQGMGGAGFPAGRKWEFVAAEPSEAKYVICNADESEPGTFKDREILSQHPHLVIEGMLLAGLTIHAEQGILFIRHEYEPERKAFELALEHARSLGILGENAAGSGKRFDVEIFVSPGGYILGEETALLEALEDKRGEPRNKPPYPGTHGLWGKPTLINNVETFAWATTIIHRGADWWNSHGVNGAKGRKFVCISGDVKTPGVFEIPLGTRVNELIEMAGGMQDGKQLLAFLPGGASSNFLPADKADTPLDFTAMQQAGSMLGTGAVIVFAEDRDLFAMASNLVKFFRNESCGKCVPCRVGSQHTVEMLDGIDAGKRSSQSLSQLPDLGDTLEQTSICGLGQVALNPILSLLKHFPDLVAERTGFRPVN